MVNAQIEQPHWETTSPKECCGCDTFGRDGEADELTLTEGKK